MAKGRSRKGSSESFLVFTFSKQFSLIFREYFESDRSCGSVPEFVPGGPGTLGFGHGMGVKVACSASINKPTSRMPNQRLKPRDRFDAIESESTVPM